MIEAGKKLPIVDVGSAFYPNMVSFVNLQEHINLLHQPGAVQSRLLSEHAEDQPGKGVLHGGQAHHHAGGGGGHHHQPHISG